MSQSTNVEKSTLNGPFENTLHIIQGKTLFQRGL